LLLINGPVENAPRAGIFFLKWERTGGFEENSYYYLLSTQYRQPAAAHNRIDNQVKQLINRILTVLSRKEKQKFWQIAIYNVVVSLLDIGFLVALLFLINFYTRDQEAISQFFLAAIIQTHPILTIGSFFLFFALKNLFAFLISKMEFRFVYNVAARISKDKLMEYLNGPYYDHVHIDSSIINRQINQQPIEFCHYVLNGLQQVFCQSVLILITIVAILAFNPYLFPLLLLIFIPPVFLIGLLMRRKLHVARLRSKRTSEKTIQHLQEALNGFVESNVYQKANYFAERYYRFQSQLNHYLAERLIIQNMPSRLIEVFAIFGLFVLITLNTYSTHDGSISLVTIGAFMVAAYKIIPGIVKITSTVSQIRTYAYSIDGLALMLNTNNLTTCSKESLDAVVFEKVSFNYPDKNVLNDFSFGMKKGEMVGITGVSGKGKTTFVNLLLGFLKQDAGNIRFNGEIISAEDRQKCWNRITYMKQQSFFINASVAENIALEEVKHDRSKMDWIVRITGIDQFVSFSSSSETIIAENGKNFSGGQRQRIGFARALYKDFDLLILDEPFNELDEASEMEMMKHLQRISFEGKMILLITHNTKALSFCNRTIEIYANG
jgi:ABC-type multidrug transport system fused ATPase/permease subunit